MKTTEKYNEKYRELRGMFKRIASECDVSPSYVRKICSGERVGKTDRAKKEAAVLRVVNRYMAAICPDRINNSINQ